MSAKNGMTVSKRKKMRKRITKNPKKQMEVPDNRSASNPFKIEWPQTGGGGNKLVGAYIPRREAEYLNLMATHHGTTVSELIRQKVMELIEGGTPEEEIINSLVNMAGKEWESRLKTNQGESGWLERIDLMTRWREYQQEVRLLLIKRNIADSLIVRIIRKLEIAYKGL